MRRRDLQLLSQIPFDRCLPAGTEEMTDPLSFMKACIGAPINFLSKSVRSSLGTVPMSAQNRLNTGRTSESVFRPYTNLESRSLVNEEQCVAESFDGRIRAIEDIAMEDVAKGTLVWKCKPGVNVRQFKGEKAVRKHIDSLKNFEARKDWLVHAYMDHDKLNEILEFDVKC